MLVLFFILIPLHHDTTETKTKKERENEETINLNESLQEGLKSDLFMASAWFLFLIIISANWNVEWKLSER